MSNCTEINADLICDGTHVCISNFLWNVTGYMSHICGGFLFVVLVTIWFQYVVSRRTLAFISFTILLLPFTLAKELWYDESYESDDEAGQAWKDIITLLAGGILGVGTVLLPPRDKHWSYYLNGDDGEYSYHRFGDTSH